jgi:hypothetical protein
MQISADPRLKLGRAGPPEWHEIAFWPGSICIDWWPPRGNDAP